jgi:hypothetical protein
MRGSFQASTALCLARAGRARCFIVKIGKEKTADLFDRSNQQPFLPLSGNPLKIIC